MLSYQHGYHAGNFADVMKHLTLVRVLDYLCKKEKPLFYFESHAGKGLYDLTSVEARKTGEAQQGIQSLWTQQQALPEIAQPYFDVIKTYNPNGTLRYYPGSPAFALQRLREQDRLYCCELHPREIEALRQLPGHRSQMKMHISHSEGMQTMLAQLPPPERRGLILIDPSYEVKSEYRTIPDFVSKAYQKFNTGVYCIWYPLLRDKWHVEMMSALAKISPNYLRVEFNFCSTADQGMIGSGLWLINPPYLLANELQQVLSQLCELLNAGVSTFKIEGS